MSRSAGTVLFVCHANLCRSPVAQHLAEPALRPHGIVAASAGTHAYPGLAVHPDADAALRERGITTAGFRSRRLQAELVAEADLILTATRDQRSSCVALEPGAVRRTFTITQFGRIAAVLAHATPPSTMGIAEVLAAVPAVRAELPLTGGDGDDLDDPIGGTPAQMRACVRRIEAALKPLLHLIAGCPPVAPARSVPRLRSPVPG